MISAGIGNKLTKRYKIPAETIAIAKQHLKENNQSFF